VDLIQNTYGCQLYYTISHPGGKSNEVINESQRDARKNVMHGTIRWHERRLVQVPCIPKIERLRHSQTANGIPVFKFLETWRPET
jgi:hypothetical protein